MAHGSLQADFDDDTMRELERKRRARAQEAAEHRKELRRKSQELGAEKAKAHEKEIKVRILLLSLEPCLRRAVPRASACAWPCRVCSRLLP